MTKNLCIIPARGGSKRIPRKNIKPFLGRPIIAYSIEAALASGLFEEVMVSTDDDEIAEVGKKYGAKVPFFRSLKSSDDQATTLDVLLEVKEDYKRKFNREFDNICCIYPTAPLIEKEKLIQGYNILQSGDFNSVVPVVKFSYPIWRGLKHIGNGKGEMIFKEHLNSRSQDFPEAYHDAGQWYWFKARDLELGAFEKFSIVELNSLKVQDIDTYDDWALAEIKYNFHEK